MFCEVRKNTLKINGKKLEVLIKEIKTYLKLKALELKNSMTEIKNQLHGINGRMEKIEKRVSELKNRPIGIIQSKWQKKKEWKNSKSCRDLCSHIKMPNIYVIGVLEEQEKQLLQKNNIQVYLKK